MTPEAVAWHLNGEHGISSEAIFDRLTYGRTSTRWHGSHPHDPDDFRRCELLLRAVPEFRTRFTEMADVSAPWAALVGRWADIVTLCECEVPGVFDGGDVRGAAPKTYRLMRSVIDTSEGRANR